MQILFRIVLNIRKDIPISGDEVLEIMPVLEKLPVQIVFDHHAMISCKQHSYKRAVDAVVSLIKNKQAYVKLGGFTYTSDTSKGYEETRKLSEYFINADENRCLWGSDWPHPNNREEYRQLDGYTDKINGFDFILLNQLSKYPCDETIRHKILVDNPAKLYRF